jgi:hypothetical protein
MRQSRPSNDIQLQLLNLFLYLDRDVVERIKEPYSVALWCGDLAGSSEAVTSRDHDVRYERITEDDRMKAWPAERPMGLTSWLKPIEYDYVEGEIELGKCPECGGPAALSDYVWSMER